MHPQESIRYEELRHIQNLSQLGQLADKIRRCIINAFGREPEHIEQAIRGDRIILAVTQDENVVGFCTMYKKVVGDHCEHPALNALNSETPIFYFGAASIDKKYQGSEIYSELNRRRISLVLEERTPIILSRTQNPKVEKNHRRAFEACITNGEIESYALDRHRQPRFFSRRLTDYPIDTTGTPYEDLDIDAGDAYLLAYHLTYPQINSQASS